MWISLVRVTACHSKTVGFSRSIVGLKFSSSPQTSDSTIQSKKAVPSFFKNLHLHNSLSASLRQNKIVDPTDIQEYQYLNENIKETEEITTNNPNVKNVKGSEIQKKINKERASLSFDNISRSINWNEQDVVVATPTQLEPLLLLKDKTNPYDVDPKIIAVDEFDLLLGDTNVARSTVAILNRFASLKKNPMNEMRQFILTAASLPKKINKEDTSTYLGRILRKPLWFESEQFYRISEKMEHVVVNVGEYLASNSSLTENDILFNVIRKSNSKRIIIFTGSSETTLNISGYLKQTGISAIAFHAKLSTEERLEALQAFEEARVRVLVSTDLGCRGLDFQRVDHVIQFDFALDAVSFLHRVGRTCRMGNSGTVTSFVRQSDVFFYSKVKAVLEANNRIDPIVSRKRSLSKSDSKNQEGIEEPDDENEIEGELNETNPGDLVINKTIQELKEYEESQETEKKSKGRSSSFKRR